jgi:hypothetical protein
MPYDIEDHMTETPEGTTVSWTPAIEGGPVRRARFQPITDQDRIAKYGVCWCGAPRDAYLIEWADGSQEMRAVCTGTVNPPDDWGHEQ